jgi:tripartite-type tricarboxylate transporter receptor subunit TctC
MMSATGPSHLAATRRHILGLGGAGLAGIALPGSAGSQTPRPSGPVSVVIPLAPGGITDALARVSAEWLAARLNRPFVTENVVGGSGAVAAARVARARPDAPTLLFGNVGTLCVTPFIQRAEFSAEDFDPVSIVGTGPMFLIVGPRLRGVSTTREFVAAARGEPGGLTYASAGTASLTHLAGAMVVQKGGFEATHVPYRGAGPAFTDLLAGNVHFMMATTSELASYLPAPGQPVPVASPVRVLGISTLESSPRWPAIPPISATLPGYDAITWNGYVAPRNAPASLVEEVSRELRAAARDPGFVARLDRLGTDPLEQTPAEFARRISADVAMWRSLIAALGLQVT